MFILSNQANPKACTYKCPLTNIPKMLQTSLKWQQDKNQRSLCKKLRKFGPGSKVYWLKSSP